IHIEKILRRRAADHVFVFRRPYFSKRWFLPHRRIRFRRRYRPMGRKRLRLVVLVIAARETFVDVARGLVRGTRERLCFGLGLRSLAIQRVVLSRSVASRVIER